MKISQIIPMSCGATNSNEYEAKTLINSLIKWFQILKRIPDKHVIYEHIQLRSVIQSINAVTRPIYSLQSSKWRDVHFMLQH